MAYLKIPNLYQPRAQNVLLFKEVYALEKIHGTSTHIAWKDNAIRFFSGGCDHKAFVALFDEEKLISQFKEIDRDDVTIYGEGYGGKMQGMSETYGKELRFVAFDVKIEDKWLSVPSAVHFVSLFGLDFVSFVFCSTDLASLDAQRDGPSQQAIKCGIDEERMREGIVIRPPEEFTDNSDARVIAKHKRAEFSERKTNPGVDLSKREKIMEAREIADEFVTDMRLSHVLDEMGNPLDMSACGDVIKAVMADIFEEDGEEIEDTRIVRKVMGTAIAKAYKTRLMGSLGKEAE